MREKERICRLYKNLLVYYKLDGRDKYGYQTLQLLAQLNFLLPPGMAHELKWNRFTNTKVRPDSNVELDRELEHRNKYVKEEIKSFRGKVTADAIDRASKSYGPMEKIIENFDIESGHKKESGKHTPPDWSDDVKELAAMFVTERLFTPENGRGFTLSKLNTEKIEKWAKKKLTQFQLMDLYQHKTVTINNT